MRGLRPQSAGNTTAPPNYMAAVRPPSRVGIMIRVCSASDVALVDVTYEIGRGRPGLLPWIRGISLGRRWTDGKDHQRLELFRGIRGSIQKTPSADNRVVPGFGRGQCRVGRSDLEFQLQVEQLILLDQRNAPHKGVGPLVQRQCPLLLQLDFKLLVGNSRPVAQHEERMRERLLCRLHRVQFDAVGAMKEPHIPVRFLFCVYSLILCVDNFDSSWIGRLRQFAST